MGEAKRRKRLLGSNYGQPLGLSTTARQQLIDQHLESLLFQHYEACGYTDWLHQSCQPETRFSPPTANQPTDLSTFLDGLTHHWQNTFNGDFPRSALQIAVQSIIDNRPLFLTPFSHNELDSNRTMEPIITLPQARSYFHRLLSSGQILLPQHDNLLLDVLTVFAQDSSFSLLQRLLLTEFNDVIVYALQDRPAWISPYVHPDDWVDLTDDVLFQAGNCALLGILTLIITLPWEHQLKRILN